MTLDTLIKKGGHELEIFRSKENFFFSEEKPVKHGTGLFI